MQARLRRRAQLVFGLQKHLEKAQQVLFREGLGGMTLSTIELGT